MTILPLLKEQDDEFKVERSVTSDAVLVEALLWYCHQANQSEVRAAELAKRVSVIHKGRGLVREVSAETIGWALRRLGLRRERLGSAGNGIRLTADSRRLVHQLALALNVRAVDAGSSKSCKECIKPKVNAARFRTV